MASYSIFAFSMFIFSTASRPPILSSFLNTSPEAYMV